jgi:hypothetical protein
MVKDFEVSRWQNDIQHSDIQHNNKCKATLRIIALDAVTMSVVYA